MKQGLPGVPTWQEYLVKNLSAGSRIGLDPTLINAGKQIHTHALSIYHCLNNQQYSGCPCFD